MGNSDNDYKMRIYDFQNRLFWNVFFLKYSFSILFFRKILPPKMLCGCRFHHKNPEDTEEVPGGFLSDCNENSLTILHRVFVDKYMGTITVWDRFQFERIGFFSVDPDTTSEKVLFSHRYSYSYFFSFEDSLQSHSTPQGRLY